MVDAHTLTENSQEAEHTSRPKVRIDLSDQLKSLLVDDWENVTKAQKLRPLPAEYPVSAILADYDKLERPKRKEGSADLKLLEETIQGLADYFDKCIGRILLYK